VPQGRVRERIDSIDFLKPAAIVSVVMTHSGFNPFNPNATVWDRVLARDWTWFNVPSFLLVSGFLYFSHEPASLRDVARRLARVLIPYVLATLFMQAVGTTKVDGLRQSLYQIATATALGPYYYIALISGCTLLLWPLSRLERGGAAALLAALIAYAIAVVFWPGLRFPSSPVWSERNPLEAFALGYFVLGWVAAQHRAKLAPLLAQHRQFIACVASVGVVFWFVSVGRIVNRGLLQLDLVLYSLSVVALILGLTHGRRAPRAVRFLSAATLTIYLYHVAPQAVARAWVLHWPPPLRIGFQLALGVGSGCLLVLVGRRVLGAERARRFLGA